MSRAIRIFLVLIILTVAVGGGYLYYTQSLLGGTTSWFSFMSSDEGNEAIVENSKTLGFQANIVEVGKEAFDFKNVFAQNSKSPQNPSMSSVSSGNMRSSGNPVDSFAVTSESQECSNENGEIKCVSKTMDAGTSVVPPSPESVQSLPYEYQIKGGLPEIASELAVYQKQVSEEFQNTSLDLSQIIQLQSKKLQNVTLQDGEYSVSLDFAMGNIGIYKNYDEKQAVEDRELMEKEEIITETDALSSATEFLNRFGINVTGLDGPKVQKPEKSGGCPPNARCMMPATSGSEPASSLVENASPQVVESEGMMEGDQEDVSENISSADPSTGEKRAADSAMIWPGPVGYGPYTISYTMEIGGQKVLNQWDQNEISVLSISVNSASGKVESLSGWIAAVTFQKSAYSTISSDEIMKILKKGGMNPQTYWGEEKNLDPIVFDSFQIGLVEYGDWQNQSTYYVPTLFAKAENSNAQTEWDKTIMVSIPLISHKYLPFLPDYENGNGGGVPMPLMEKSPL